MRTFEILGVPISTLSLQATCQFIEASATDDCGRFICIRDVASLMAIRGDPATASLHSEAAVVTPDGMPLVFLGKLKGIAMERVCGPDLIEEMMSRSTSTGPRHYFFGGRECVAREMARKFSQRYPSANIVGFECPPFGELSEGDFSEVRARISASGADVVWVGLSSPKQDVWMWKNYKKMRQTLIGVGAAFDFHAGTVKRAPLWMQKVGLEWAYRFSQEPRRLYKRYLLVAPKFVGLMLVELLLSRRR